MLTAAWLAYSMGWRAPGEELVRSRDGWKLTLRTGQKGQVREVVILIREVDDVASAGGISSIRITSGLTTPGIFTVRRTGPDTITTISDTPSAGVAERTIYSANPDEASLLGTELRQFDADPSSSTRCRWPRTCGRREAPMTLSEKSMDYGERGHVVVLPDAQALANAPRKRCERPPSRRWLSGVKPT